MAGAMLISCGGGGNKDEKKEKYETVIKPQSTVIKGDLGGYLEVVNGETKVEAIEEFILYQINFKVKIKSIGTTSEEFYGLEDGNHGPLYLEALDASGVPISGWDNIASVYSDDAKIQDLLKKKGEEYWVTFNTTKNTSETKILNSFFKEVSSFTILSKPISKPEEEAGSTSSSSNTTSVSGNGDWDSLLDDYEDMFDDYIKLVKKAKNNDNSALSEYPKVYSEMMEVGQKLEKAGNDLSPEQMTRFMEIQMKAMKAAAELSK